MSAVKFILTVVPAFFVAGMLYVYPAVVSTGMSTGTGTVVVAVNC